MICYHKACSSSPLWTSHAIWLSFSPCGGGSSRGGGDVDVDVDRSTELAMFTSVLTLRKYRASHEEMGMSYLPSHLKTWIFIAYKVGYFLLSAFGLHHNAPCLVNLYLFLNPSPAPSTGVFPVESQGAVIKRWYHRFWHAVAGPDLFRAFWGAEGLNLCWTLSSLCVERVDESNTFKYIHSKTDVHLVYIFGGATLVRVLLVFMKKRITWAVAKTHPRLHYDVGLLKKTYSLQYHHCGIWGHSKMLRSTLDSTHRRQCLRSSTVHNKCAFWGALEMRLFMARGQRCCSQRWVDCQDWDFKC